MKTWILAHGRHQVVEGNKIEPQCFRQSVHDVNFFTGILSIEVHAILEQEGNDGVLILNF